MYLGGGGEEEVLESPLTDPGQSAWHFPSTELPSNGAFLHLCLRHMEFICVASDSEIPSLDSDQTHVKVRREGVPSFFLFGEVRRDESFLQSVVKKSEIRRIRKTKWSDCPRGSKVYVRQTWGNFTQWVMRLKSKQVNASLHMAFTVLSDLLTPEVTGAVPTLYSYWSQPRSQNDSYVTCCTVLFQGEKTHKQSLSSTTFRKQ